MRVLAPSPISARILGGPLSGPEIERATVGVSGSLLRAAGALAAREAFFRALRFGNARFPRIGCKIDVAGSLKGERTLQASSSRQRRLTYVRLLSVVLRGCWFSHLISTS